MTIQEKLTCVKTEQKRNEKHFLQWKKEMRQYMKDDYSDVILSQGLVCLNTNNNALCVVLDGHKGSENDRCSTVLECSGIYGFIVHTPPNRSLRPTGKICPLQPIAKMMAQYVATE